MLFKIVKPLKIISTFFPPDKKAWASIVGTQPCRSQCNPFFVEGQEKRIEMSFEADDHLFSVFAEKSLDIQKQVRLPFRRFSELFLVDARQ